MLLLLHGWCCCAVLQAGIIPRIFKYLWQRMPEVQAGLLAAAHPSSSSTCASMCSSSSSLAYGDMRRSLHAEDSSSRVAEQPSLKWLVRCSMLEISKCVFLRGPECFKEVRPKHKRQPDARHHPSCSHLSSSSPVT
jgi:hypothetical protein